MKLAWIYLLAVAEQENLRGAAEPAKSFIEAAASVETDATASAKAAQMGDQNAQYTALEANAGKSNTDQETKLTNEQTRYQEESQSVTSQHQPTIDDTNERDAVLTERNAADEAVKTNEANELDRLANGMLAMQQQNAQEAATTTQATKDAMTREEDAYRASWNEAATDSLSELLRANTETEQEAVQRQEAIENEAEETTEASEEGNNDLNDEMSEQKDEFEESHEAFMDTAKAGFDSLKDVRKSFKKAQMEAKKQVQAIQNEVDKLPGSIASEKRQVMKDISDGIKDVRKTSASALKDSKKEALSLAKDQWKEAKAEAKEIASEAKESFKDLSGEAADVDENDNDQIASAAEVLQEQASAANSLRTVLESVKADSSNLDTKTRASIQQQADSLKIEIQDVASSIATETSDMKRGIDGKIAQAMHAAYNSRTQLKNQASETIKSRIADLNADIKKGTAEVKKADEELKTTVATQEENIASNTQALTQNDRDADTQLAEIHKLYDEGNTTLHASQAEFSKKITESFEELKKFSEDAVLGTEKEAAESVKVAQDAADSAKTMLETRAANIATDADTRLATGKKNMEESINKMNDTNKDMELDLDLVKKNNEQVEADLPGARMNAESAIDEVASELHTVSASLTKSRDKLSETIKNEETVGQERIMKEARDMKGTLSTEFADAEVDVDNQRQSTYQLLQALWTGIEQNKQSASEAEAKAKAEIDQGLQDANKMIEDNKEQGNELYGKVVNLTQTVKEQDRAFTRQGAELGAKGKAEANAAFRAAKDEVKAATEEAEANGEKRTESQYEQAIADLTAAKLNMDSWEAGKNEQITAVSSQYHQLTDKFSGLQKGAAKLTSDLGAEMNTIKKAQEGVKSTVDNIVAHEHSIIDEKSKELASTVQSEVNELVEANEAKLESTTGGLGQEIKNVHTEEELAAAQKEAKVQGWVVGEKGLIANIEQGREMVNGQITGLENAAQAAVSEIQAESHGLSNAVQMGSDEVNAANQKASQEVTEIQNSGLKDMEGMVGLLGAAQGEASEEVGVLQQEFKDQTNFYRNKANDEVAHVSADMQRVAANSPDVGAEFAADTKDTQTSLQDSMDRLVGSTDKEKALIGSLDERLGQVSANREQMAVKVHNYISQMKANAAKSADNAIAKVEQMTAETKLATDKMNEELRRFDMQMGSLSTTESSHDKGEIDQLDNSLFELKSLDSRLSEWELHTIARMKAWRREVDRGIRGLMASMEMDGDAIQNRQVDEELDLNKGLRDAELRLEDEVSRSAVGSAKYFQGMVNGVMNKMHGIISAEEHADATKVQEERQANRALANNGQMMTSEIGNVEANEDTLAQKQAALSANTQAAMQTIQNEILLPNLTANVGEEAEKQMQALEITMNRMSTSSFLETASTATDSMDAQALAEEQEIQAVEELNAELQRENAKLQVENANLQKGLAALPPLKHADHTATL